MTKGVSFKNFNGKIKEWWNYFTTYEKWWFFIFAVIAIVASIIMPEDGSNGISGTTITIFCVVSTIVCLLCELLAAKQSKWNAFIYIFVEILEIIKFLMIAMISNLFVSLLFWLPMHIITFINWGKKEDKRKKELTVVRKLKTKHSIMLVSGIVLWTLIIGYLLSMYLPDSFIPDSVVFDSETCRIAAAYLDACASALSIANGVLLYLRYNESWFVWMLFSLVSIAYMILVGWWIFIVLQLGYITNTIYGYLKWTKYIKENNANNNDAELDNNPDIQSETK